MKATVITVLATMIAGIGIITKSTPHRDILLNTTAILILLGGCIATALITYGIKGLNELYTNIRGILKAPKNKPEAIIIQISAAQNLVRKNHLDLVDEENFHPFLIDGLNLLQTGTNPIQINSSMNYDIIERRNRHAHDLQKLTTLSRFPIQLGFITALMTTIPIYLNQSPTQNLGEALTVPLVAILYGFLLSHFGIQPFVNRIHHTFNKDIESRRMIARGMKLILEAYLPEQVEQSLKVHVKPSRRNQRFPELPN